MIVMMMMMMNKYIVPTGVINIFINLF